ncbi:hypothetical protein [Rhodocaloribacter sp.]
MTAIPTPPETKPPAESPSTTPRTPTPRPWLEAVETTARLVARIDEAEAVLRRQWLDRVEGELLTPLRKAARTAAEEHRRLTDATAFEAADRAGAAEVWARLETYRQAATERVLAPVYERLTSLVPGRTLGDTFLEMLDALAARSGDAPERITLPEPPDLFAPAPGDPLSTRIKKASFRLRRRLFHARLRFANTVRRLFRRPLRPLPPHGYSLPLRMLFDYHLRYRLPLRYVPAHEAAQQAAAQAVARLEDAFTAWKDALLDAELALDRPRLRHPVALRWPAFAAPEATSEAPPSPASDDDASAPTPQADAAAHARRAALALQDALDAVADLPPIDAPFDEERIRIAAQLLALDIRYAGPPLFDLDRRALPPPERLPAARVEARQRTWTAWHTQARNRLRLDRRMMTLRTELLDLETTLLRKTADATLAPVFDKFSRMLEHLRETRERADRACAAASGDPDRLAATLGDLHVTLTARLDDALRDLPGLVSSDQALARPGRETWTEILRLLATLPAALTIHPPQPDGQTRIDPERRAFELKLRDLALNTLTVPLPERLKPSADPFRRKVIHVWAETEQALHIVQYNLNAALEELSAPHPHPGEAETPGEEQAPHDPAAAAYELTTGGLTRAAGLLSGLARSLREPWETFESDVVRVFSEDWSALHRQVRARGAMAEQWMGVRVQLKRRTAALRRKLDAGLERIGDRLRRLFRLGRRRAQQLIRQGQSAVGVSDEDADAVLQTLDALGSVEALQKRLPLVYRRLFSFEPLTEPLLLENRTRDLVRVRRHFERWREGRQSDALIFTALPGAGRTSFLNAVRAAALKDVDVRALSFHERIMDETALAGLLAGALDVVLDAPPSLAALEAALTRAARPDPPRACLLDNLEEVMLRTPEGMALIERLLITFSRTDTHVYWLAGINAYAWHLLNKTLPAATGLTSVQALTRMDAAALEALILSRHRRSGMPLRFEAPPALPALKRPRLGRAKTNEELQATYRQNYFNRLFRLSGQNIRLALFYWLRSADFEADDDALVIHPVKPLNFSFFNAYDLPRAFTLNAFLRHGTLTPEEHNRIFRLSEEEGALLLEALLNQRIILPLRNAPNESGGIRPEVRYHLHPLLLHPLTEFLRNRHIVY